MTTTITTPQQLKLIFKGRLEFGTPRAYDMMLKHWPTRMENYFKADILFKSEQVLNNEEFALVLPQQTILSTEKSWRNTIALLDELAQFAVAGTIKAWCIDNGNLMSDVLIEPKSDKTAVSEYRRGRDLVQQKGCYNEAAAALNTAINKYERHAAAYERRGYVNYKLQNFNDALSDFAKSISINPNVPDAYYGAGKVRMLRNEWEQAAADFEQATKRAIALESIHWLSRLKRGECLFHAKNYAEAAKELRLYLNRSFTELDPNYYRRRRAFVVLGKALAAQQDTLGSEEAFRQALALKQGSDLTPDYEALLALGLMLRDAGKPYTKELEAAAKLGSDEALRLLAEA